MDGYVILYASTIVMAVFLVYFSYLDLKYREIPDRDIYIFISASLILFSLLFAYSIVVIKRNIYLELTYLSLSLLIGPLISYILYKIDLFGLADVYAISGLSITFYNDLIYNISLYNISTIHVPPIIPLLLYANLVMATYIPFNIIRNLLVYKDVLPPKNIGILKWSIILSTGRPIKIKDFLKSKHVFPLQIFKISNSTVIVEYRTSFNIEEDYKEDQKYIKELIEKGYLHSNDYIWVTYGVPFIVLLLAGYIVLLLIGDSLIQLIVHCIIH